MRKSNDELFSVVLDPLEIRLGERIDQTEHVPFELPVFEDKWVLSSALQKLIRRGKPLQAINIGLRLHQLDPGYLSRRLPVIAIEDVGIGDLSVCRDVLLTCSATRWWRAEASRAIAFLVGAMARAIKSRSACDAVCLAEAHRGAPPLMASLLAATPSQLVGIAANRGRPRLERMNALRLLGGVTVRQGARYVQVSRCDLRALDQVACELELPPMVRWLMSQNRKTGNLACMLPIVVEAASERVVRQGGDFPHSLDALSGVPLCSVDMFSEVGRGALREFFLSSTSFKNFAARHIKSPRPIRLFNMALFHAESAILDRYLAAPALDRLTLEVEHEEMGHLGMTDPEHRMELRDLILADAGRLASIRRKRLAPLLNGAAVAADLASAEATHD